MTIYMLCNEANRVFDGNCFERNRKRENVNARMAVSVILKSRNFYTLNTIAKLFELKHDMILYYQKKHDDLIGYNPEYRELYNTLRAKVDGKIIIKDGFCLQTTFNLQRISISQ